MSTATFTPQAGRSRRLAGLMAFATMAIGALLTVITIRIEQDADAEHARMRFEHRVDDAVGDMQRRLDRSTALVVGVAALQTVSERVTDKALRAYLDDIGVSHNDPGLITLALAEPAGPRDGGRFRIMSTMASNADPRMAVGFDLGADSVLGSMARLAVDSGKVVAGRDEGPASSADGPAWLWLMAPANRAARSPAAGLAIAAISIGDVLAQAHADVRGEFAFEVLDGAAVAPHASSTPAATSRFATTRALRAQDLTLTIRAGTTAAFDGKNANSKALIVALTGISLSCMLALSIWLLAISRSRALGIARVMTSDLSRLAKVAEHTSNSVVMLDTAHRITWVNQGFVRISGYSAEEALGRCPAELLNFEGTDPAWVREIRKTLDAERPYRGQVLNRAKDGRPYWIQIELQPLHDDAGKLTGYMAVETDITAMREAADAMSRERERLDAILEGNDAGSYEWNLPTGETLVNKRAAGMLGYRLADLPPLHAALWQTLIHPDDSETWAGLMQQHLRGETELFECEVRMQHRRGHWVWLLSRCKVSARTADGRPEWVSGSFMDISRRKADEAALQKHHERLRNVTSHVAAVVYELELQADGMFRFSFVSDAILDLFDIRPEEAQADARAVGRVIEPADLPVVLAALKHSAVVLEPVLMEVQIHVNGATKWVSGEARPRRLGNGGVVWHGLITDITARKNSDDRLAQAMLLAEQAVVAKSAFLATMSHEIRTPMNGVLGMAEVLANTSLSDEQLDAVQTIRESGAALLRIIDDILDFSKIEAGRMSIERTPVSLPSLIEGACDALGTVATAAEVELDLFVDPALPEQVWSDPTRLRQLLYNLVGNAIKFSAGQADRRGRVAVRAEKAPGPNPQLVLRILDNGIGMTADTLTRLFVAFTQAEVSTTRRFGGSGLGLAICHRLVEMMHGRIDVESEPGVGSEFSVHLPLEALPEQPTGHHARLQGVKCLVVAAGSRRAADLLACLEAAGAEAEIVASVSAAAAGAAALKGPVVVVHDDDRVAAEPVAALADALAGGLGADDARHLVLARGVRGPAKMIAPNLAQVDVIRRAVFLRGIAMLAGLESPELGVPAWVRTDVIGTLDDLPLHPCDHARPGILVAEDDPINQKVIARQLALLGYTATIAANGEQALRLWREGGYGLLFTDLHMPVMDGYTLAQTIRREESGRVRLPILALTANALRGETERVLAAGMDEYLTKPVQLKALATALGRWLEKGMCDPPDAPVLDLAVLRSLVGDSPRIIEEILCAYQRSLSKLTLDLNEAFAAADPQRVVLAGHTLKSSSQSIGAIRLGALCAELESKGREPGRGLQAEDAVSFNTAVNEVRHAIASAQIDHGEPRGCTRVPAVSTGLCADALAG